MTGISLLSEFNGTQVPHHFGITRDHAIEYAAMNYVFKYMKEEMNARSLDALREATQAAIEKIEYRYNLFSQMAEDFFLGTPIDREALVLATICDELVNEINHPLADEIDFANDDIPCKQDGFDQDLMTRACTIWDDALELETGGLSSGEDEYPPESLFLAHINVMTNMGTQLPCAWSFDEADILSIYDGDIVAARRFVRTDTEIGRHLAQFLDHAEQELSVYLPADHPFAHQRARASLHLVQKLD